MTFSNDDFGWRFYRGPGTYPFDATLGTATSNVMSFYVDTWGTEIPPYNTGPRSAYLRIQYY